VIFFFVATRFFGAAFFAGFFFSDPSLAPLFFLTAITLPLLVVQGCEPSGH
jgi:hypothetical protein